MLLNLNVAAYQLYLAFEIISRLKILIDRSLSNGVLEEHNNIPVQGTIISQPLILQVNLQTLYQQVSHTLLLTGNDEFQAVNSPVQRKY